MCWWIPRGAAIYWKGQSRLRSLRRLRSGWHLLQTWLREVLRCSFYCFKRRLDKLVKMGLWSEGVWPLFAVVERHWRIRESSCSSSDVWSRCSALLSDYTTGHLTCNNTITVHVTTWLLSHQIARFKVHQLDFVTKWVHLTFCRSRCSQVVFVFFFPTYWRWIFSKCLMPGQFPSLAQTLLRHFTQQLLLLVAL